MPSQPSCDVKQRDRETERQSTCVATSGCDKLLLSRRKCWECCKVPAHGSGAMYHFGVFTLPVHRSARYQLSPPSVSSISMTTSAIQPRASVERRCHGRGDATQHAAASASSMRRDQCSASVVMTRLGQWCVARAGSVCTKVPIRCRRSNSQFVELMTEALYFCIRVLVKFFDCRKCLLIIHSFQSLLESHATSHTAAHSLSLAAF